MFFDRRCSRTTPYTRAFDSDINWCYHMGMMKFTIGQTIDLQVRHMSNVLGVGQEILRYIGKVVPTPKWLDNDYVSVHTGRPEYPVSHINKQNIVGFEFAKERMETRIFRVKSKSKGSIYNVISVNGTVSCDCIGFQFRKTCKHSEGVKNFIQNA